jgi:hypothetical protein
MQTIKDNDFIFKDDHLEEIFNELKELGSVLLLH